MKEQTATLPANPPGDLWQAPHVLAQLVDVVYAPDSITPVQQEQIGQHLATCLHCQVFVEVYLLQMLAYDKAHDHNIAPVQTLLQRLQHLTHATIKEDLPAYAEILLEQDEATAQQRFPLFANYVQCCQHCQSELNDVRSWLEQLE